MFYFKFVKLSVLILFTLHFATVKGRGGGHGHSSSHSHSHSSGGHYSGHGYPSSGGLSGSSSHSSGSSSHSYPSSHGLSGNTHSSSYSTSHHYHYTPPTQIRYTHVYGEAPISYPVYIGTPPTYVYEYKDSGSTYGTLLAGLSLYNLGRISAHSYRHHDYKPQSNEICMLGVRKSNGEYEETKIKCEIITSFIFEEEAKVSNSGTNMTFTTTTVTNMTTINVSNGQPNVTETATTVNVNYTMSPNGTIVPIVTSVNVTNNNGSITSIRETVTVTTTNTTTVSDALSVKGKEIEVTPEVQCYVIRITPTSNMKKSMPCGVLKSYADQSLRGNFGVRHASTLTLVVTMFTLAAVF